MVRVGSTLVLAAATLTIVAVAAGCSTATATKSASAPAHTSPASGLPVSSDGCPPVAAIEELLGTSDLKLTTGGHAGDFARQCTYLGQNDLLQLGADSRASVARIYRQQAALVRGARELPRKPGTELTLTPTSFLVANPRAEIGNKVSAFSVAGVHNESGLYCLSSVTIEPPPRPARWHTITQTAFQYDQQWCGAPRRAVAAGSASGSHPSPTSPAVAACVKPPARNDNTIHVQGCLTDRRHNPPAPIPAVTVSVKDLGGRVIGHDTTDATGTFDIPLPGTAMDNLGKTIMITVDTTALPPGTTLLRPDEASVREQLKLDSDVYVTFPITSR